MTQLKNFNFRFDSAGLNELCHFAKHLRSANVSSVGIILSSDIKRTDFRKEFFNMCQTFGRICHISSGAASSGIIRIRDIITAHSGGKIQHHIGRVRTNELHDFCVPLQFSSRRSCLRITYMDVRHCRTCFCSFYGGISDFFRSFWKLRMFAGCVS